MSDQNITSGEPTQPEPAGSFNEWLGEVTGAIVPVETETNDDVISIITTAGGQFDLPVGADELLSVSNVLQRSGLYVSGAVEYWVNGVQVAPDYQVGPGARVSVVGVVKGG